MNVDYWGAKFPVDNSAANNGPGAALLVMDMGPMNLVDAGGAQVLSPTDAGVTALTVPAGAVKARLQVVGSSLWYSTTGTDPVIATGNGFQVPTLTIIELYGYDAMANFKMRAHTGGTPKVYVEYYKHSKLNQA